MSLPELGNEKCFKMKFVFTLVSTDTLKKNVKRVLKTPVLLIRIMVNEILTTVTPISTDYKRGIVTKYGVSPEKVHVVEVVVDGVKPLNSDENSKNQFSVIYSGVFGFGIRF